ncbi:MAG TPA: DUF502 domain-containing protein [Phycisphaerae bacterium]|nr:DUF502 domain-containing protein [Phycisphaerae bacterium]
MAALLPTLLTIAILIWAYNLIDQHLGRHITRGMVLLFATSGPPAFAEPEDALKYGTPLNEWDSRGRQMTVEYKVVTHPAADPTTPAYGNATDQERRAAKRACNLALWTIAFRRYRLHLLGFLIAIILVYFVGLFLASLIGRTTWHLVENAIFRVPLIRAIYPNIKQVTDFLFTDRQLQFSGVVAVQYPRKGLWSVGLVTGPPLKTVQDAAGEELITIFIPSSPTPVTGYVITAAKRDVVDLALSMDEVLRYTISGGVIRPTREMLERATAGPITEDGEGIRDQE